jgi:hypothetical protein
VAVWFRCAIQSVKALDLEAGGGNSLLFSHTWNTAAQTPGTTSGCSLPKYNLSFFGPTTVQTELGYTPHTTLTLYILLLILVEESQRGHFHSMNLEAYGSYMDGLPSTTQKILQIGKVFRLLKFT